MKLLSLRQVEYIRPREAKRIEKDWKKAVSHFSPSSKDPQTQAIGEEVEHFTFDQNGMS